MSHRSKPPVTKKNGPSLNLSSMLDVGFLMLIFFLLTAAQRPIEADLTMQLPSMHSQQMSPVCSIGEELLISVLPNGKIVLDGSVLDTDIHSRNLPLLEGKLKQYKDAADLMSTQTFVIVNADDESQFQRFIDVFNTLSKVGIRNIYLTGLASGPS